MTRDIIRNLTKRRKDAKTPPSRLVSPHSRHANGGNKREGREILRLCVKVFICAAIIVSLAGSGGGRAAQPPVDGPNAWQSKVDEWVLQSAAAGETEFIVFLAEQADLSGAETLSTKLEKGRYVYNALIETAQRTQPAVLQALVSHGTPHQAFWVANMILVRGNEEVLSALAQRSDVAHIFANPAVQVEEEEIASLRFTPGGLSGAERPPRNDNIAAPSTIEWNLSLVGAPQVWQAGFTGQGVVIGGQDTGYDWDHPALKNQYRGWDGAAADHNYSWHDAIHALDPHNLIGSNPCGLDSQVPCDDNGHGTHTMGIMVGDDGAGNQIGMAAGARWIGCRNMERGWGTPSTYAECYEWFIAPTKLNGQDPDPAMAPDVINNSWICPPEEGCSATILEAVVHSVTAAGILSVQAAGNSGPACSTVDSPAAIYSDSFTIANTTNVDALANSSSRGPVTVDGSGRRKPDAAAPGTNIRSSLPGTGYGSKSGTSMAAPHVAGLAALLISARPELSGQVNYLRQIIEQTSNRNVSVPVSVPQSCGGYTTTTVPNNHFGWGRIEAAKALNAALVQVVKQAPAKANVGEVITYTLTLTNLNPSYTFQNVALVDIFPSETLFVRASEPYTLSLNKLHWDWLTLDPGESQEAWLVVQLPLSPGIVTNQDYSWQSDGFGQIYGEPVQTIVQYPYQYIFPMIFNDWTQ